MGAKKRQSKAQEEKTKIIIVDDHPIIRKGLSDLINQERDLVVCGQAEDVHEGLQAIKT
ncbi:MAG: hypothetical protein JSW23_04030 [Planctomycetota bacterium]|nr:MAG: hypothetical protein JSW23_04030 [Planctomycetota bacterium]